MALETHATGSPPEAGARPGTKLTWDQSAPRGGTSGIKEQPLYHTATKKQYVHLNSLDLCQTWPVVHR